MSDTLTIEDVHRGPQVIDLSKPCDFICDIDGTIADLTHRRHWVATKPQNWAAFEKTMHLDTPIDTICDAVRTLDKHGFTVVYCSGRGMQNYEVTRDWLERYDLPEGDLFMRIAKDYRSDEIVKSELLDTILDCVNVEYQYDPKLVLDDRDRVVKMWRDRGLYTIQVAEGDF